MDSTFLTGVVNAKERRVMAILDVTNTFLHAQNYKRVLILFCGKLAEMIVSIYPSMYRKYITYSAKGVSMLYVCLSKALYGMLRAIMLFYKRLRSELEAVGFKGNP